MKGQVLAALKNSNWDYRTVAGIAKELKIPKYVVVEVIRENRDKVLISAMKSPKGEELYALKNKKSKLQDYWSSFRSMTAQKYG
ncbi:hypothetical protein CLH62_17005 [Marinobacter guineae]|uniref:Uncharacterized protein n=1 Tax=Marinobacter guineae TaxID=432303 RepID=A0A2G1VCV2_9GAMM|nr:hypothetical protein [Marinobacter guineae]PHQ24588.1 hypothetical protein CLH62_17005 [Marinobacter guineae]